MLLTVNRRAAVLRDTNINKKKRQLRRVLKRSNSTQRWRRTTPFCIFSSSVLPIARL